MSHETPTLEAETRTTLGTRYAIRLRDAGRLPAVVYGHKEGPVHVSVDKRAFNEIAESSAHLIEIKIDGKAEPCLLKAIQYDHLDRYVVHADFARVDLNEAVEVELEVNFTGDAVGLKEAGAMLDTPHTTVVVSCKANNIPDVLEHAIGDLKVDESVHASDLKLPAGVELVTEGDLMLAHIIVRAAVADDTEEGAAEATAPEVIGEKKEEEDA
ncbi:MAG: 50S ribosomal protein L25 [Algisphaera sp.]